jgi:hypothetical protein
MKTIYVLRSQCEACNLDKMDVFYRIPNATPRQLADKLKKEIRKKFLVTYWCKHTVKFTLEKEKEYVWDDKLNKAVKV